MTDLLASRLIDAGLGRYAATLISLVQPCLRLRVSDVAPDWPEVISKLGGAPDVPPDFTWPTWKNAPLAFIGQINLADVTRFEAASALPTTGLLSFFYDAEQTAWGFDPNDRGSAWTFWFPESAALTRRSLPDALPQHGRFRAGRLSYHQASSLPSHEAYDVAALSMSRNERDAYIAVWEQTQNDGPQHQVLGHPNPIQDEMQLECQLVSHGIYCGSTDGYRDPRRIALEAGARDWRLLLQVDSDDSLGMMWGDVGVLYYWITNSNLAARRFDRAWMIMQCS